MSKRKLYGVGIKKSGKFITKICFSKEQVLQTRDLYEDWEFMSLN